MYGQRGCRFKSYRRIQSHFHMSNARAWALLRNHRKVDIPDAEDVSANVLGKKGQRTASPIDRSALIEPAAGEERGSAARRGGHGVEAGHIMRAADRAEGVDHRRADIPSPVIVPDVDMQMRGVGFDQGGRKAVIVVWPGQRLLVAEKSAGQIADDVVTRIARDEELLRTVPHIPAEP